MCHPTCPHPGAAPCRDVGRSPGKGSPHLRGPHPSLSPLGSLGDQHRAACVCPACHRALQCRVQAASGTSRVAASVSFFFVSAYFCTPLHSSVCRPGIPILVAQMAPECAGHMPVLEQFTALGYNSASLGRGISSAGCGWAGVMPGPVRGTEVGGVSWDK